MTNYWLKRTQARVYNAESIGIKAMQKMLPVYDQALKNIEGDIKKLFETYSDDKGIKVNELEQILTGFEQEDFKMNIHKKIVELGYSIFDIYDEKYIGRLTRLEALKQQLYWEIVRIAPKEQKISDQTYREVIDQAYKVSIQDIRENIGQEFRGFEMIDPLVKEEILKGDWQGSSYDKRIWINVNKMGQRIQEAIPRIIGGGALVGNTYSKVAKQIREEFEVGKYDAMRLVRTETNYFQNQAELQSYKDEEVEYYEYIAILDNRTSRICERLDGEVFKVEDAQAGFNYPPMHPNCRSSTGVVFNEEAKGKKVWTPTGWKNYLKADKTIQEFEKEYKKDPKENGAIIDIKTGDKVATASGNYGEVNFKDSEWEKAKNNTIIHNHPPTGEFTSFSAPDISIAITKGAYETIVIGEEGMYRMRLGNIAKMNLEERKIIADNIKETYIKKLAERDRDTSDYLFNSKLWKSIARKYDLHYGEKINRKQFDE